MNELRYEARQPKNGRYSLRWKSRDGKTHLAEGWGLDVSASGLGIESANPLKEGSILYVKAGDGSVEGNYEVAHCTSRGAKFHIGMEFREDMKPEAEKTGETKRSAADADHYETLQISRKADMETIHRVFRIMAVRFHPDNPETGNVELFLRMKQAYAVLSDPERRAEYDSKLDGNRGDGPKPIFALKDFVTGVKAESNRRLGVLSLLYSRRQTNPEHPGISLLDLEREMGFPREYLTFTTWYLLAKNLVSVADNSDYMITAAGIDFVERKAVRNEIVSKLLYPGRPGVQVSSKPHAARSQGPSDGSRRYLLPASSKA